VIFVGLIFLGVGSKSNGNDGDFNNHVGALSMLMILGLFASAQSVMLSFPFERPMFLREFSTGTCKKYCQQKQLFTNQLYERY